MRAFRGLADAGIQTVGGIELAVEPGQFWLSLIEMTDIVLGRVFSAALVEQAPHLVLQRHTIVALLHHVILVEDVAEEMTVIELLLDLRVDLSGQVLDPILVVAAQRDVERDDILDLAGMDGAIPHRRSRDGEAVQEGGLALFGRAFEHGAAARERVSTDSPAPRRCPNPHAQQQVVFVAVAEVVHPSGQVLRHQPGHGLRQPVRDGRAQPQALGQSIRACLGGVEGGHPVSSGPLNEQERVLAVLRGNVVGLAMDVLACDRQVPEVGKDVTADLGQLGRIIRADVENGCLLFSLKGV